VEYVIEDLTPIEPDVDIMEVLCQHVSVLWKEWPMDMTAVTQGPPYGLFTLRGTCPHCREIAGFILVVSPTHPNTGGVTFSEEAHGPAQRMWGIMRCQSCLDLILACAVKDGGGRWIYMRHYPLGKPDDSVNEHIPLDIAVDFKEALRCRWVDAYNATMEMCRRSLEASCNEKKAPGGKHLVEKIDWLADQGIITDALRGVAHKIRLGGNYGAHASEDPMNAEPVKPEHADALIGFLRHYFQHVYVMPAELAKYDFTKAGMKKLPTP